MENFEDGAFWALENVSFNIEVGTTVGLVGRNGSGKSTLLKIISRITNPTKGQLRIWGRVASLLEVGTGFHPDLSGKENIFFNGSLLGMTKLEIQSKYDQILEFSEIGDFIHMPVKKYSSGMYTRLAFAVGAFLESEILIIDEVLEVIADLGVDLTVGLIGIPWPAPHTRPVGVTFHATKPELIRGHHSTLGELEIPGHIAALLELRLGQAGQDAMGLAVQVPHYLVQFEYPRAAIALLRALSGAAGLVLPTDELEEAAGRADAEIDRQTHESEEFPPLLTALELQYDAGVAGDADAAEEGGGSPLPDADQIGAQVERFLSEMDSHRPESGT